MAQGQKRSAAQIESLFQEIETKFKIFLARENHMRRTATSLTFAFLVLVVPPEGIQQARAQANPYPAMAPLEEYWRSI